MDDDSIYAMMCDATRSIRVACSIGWRFRLSPPSRGWKHVRLEPCSYEDHSSEELSGPDAYREPSASKSQSFPAELSADFDLIMRTSEILTMLLMLIHPLPFPVMPLRASVRTQGKGEVNGVCEQKDKAKMALRSFLIGV